MLFTAKFWGGVVAAAAAIGLIYLVAFDSSVTFLKPSGGRLALRSTLATLPGEHMTPHETPRFKLKPNHSKATAREVAELLSQVAHDLKPWSESGISLEMVEKAYCTEEIFESMRIQIINGLIYLVGPTANYQSRARTMQLQLVEVQKYFQLPDVDFVMTTSDKCKTGDAPHRSHDGDMERCQRLAPLFSNDKIRDEAQCVAVPDFAFGGWPEAYLPEWSLARELLSAAADRRPWQDRDGLIFWRGGDTNTERKILSESELVQGSGLADVHLMSWGDGYDVFQRDFVSLAEHCNYRYLLHLSGVGYSSRLKYLLQCGSAVVFPHKRDHEHVEFWYHMLRDRHNILLTDSISWENRGEPMLKAVQELQGNETWASSIAAAGRHLAKEVLHPDNVARYWMELLTQYSALQTFNLTGPHADAVPLDVAILRPDRIVEVKARTCTVC